MTLDEFFDQVQAQLQTMEHGLIARQEVFAEELLRLKHDVSVLKTKVFALEHKGVGE